MDWNQLKQRGRDYAERGRAAAMDLAEKGKNELRAANAQTRLADAQRQLGALVYSLARSGEANQALVDQYVADIAAIEAEIEELHARGPEVMESAVEAVRSTVNTVGASLAKGFGGPIEGEFVPVEEEEPEEEPVDKDIDPKDVEPEPVAPAVRFCSQCGAEVSEGALFCNKCGAKL